MDKRQEITQQLTEMGFNALEADIYLFLLIEGEQTGYAIAKGINKAAANVYKALEALSSKGAIEYSLSNKKTCTAIHWQQLLERRKKQFNHTWQCLSDNLETYKPIDKQREQVYQIEQAEQVIEQVLHLIQQAQHTLLADIEPKALPWFKNALEAAATRGVEIWVKLYLPADIKGVNVMLRKNGAEIFEKTDDIAFRFAADGNAMVMADLTVDGKNVIQAYRSYSALMAFSIYNGLLHEIVMTGMKKLLPDNDFSGAKALLEQTAHLHPISTQNQVFQHYYQNYQTKRQGVKGDKKTS